MQKPLIEQILALHSQAKALDPHRLRKLDGFFRAGRLPFPALEGVYAGELLAVDVAPGLSLLGDWFLRRGMAWQGKVFDPAHSNGINLFRRSSLALARGVWPFYHYYPNTRRTTYQAFPFRTYHGAGRADPTLQVLKIDYNLAINPSFSVRRMLDELVQVEQGLYLGKAHFHWWWRKWQTIAYFLLRGIGEQEFPL